MTEPHDARAPGQPGATPLNRTLTPVSGDSSLSRFGRVGGVVVLGLVCGLLILAPWKDRPKPPAAQTSVPKQVVAFEPAAPTLANPGSNPPQLGAADPDGAEADASIAMAELDDASQAQAQAERQSQARREAARVVRHAPVLAWSAGSGRRSSPRGVEPVAVVEADDDPDQAGESSARQASVIGTAMAKRLSDRNFLITAGTQIPCTLQTAMDSSVPGHVACLIARDVWSESGGVVVLEKGSRVLGQYRQGLKTGEGRLYVVWSRAVTPQGVAITLNSPASDAMGRAGFGGEVERHFWRRFGGAVLLSIVDAAPVTSLERSGERQLARLPSDAAAIAVDRSIDIAPTLRKPQGAQVSIFVAQDLDFSSVYQLQAR
ncbi:TrbI/VirB10 family protein [Caulobacter sp. NIBR2454]|uniref:TrbI/VirB10 family protein n=1 Tax=Caulobacter sp. NIBR2454 TaxID=3015996 RepID=UPI0022B6057C|nr:TrbI/VirB10 family protein [Caulobacter sp. NIBR2454]